MVKKIAEEHRVLEGLFANAIRHGESSNSEESVRESVLELREALEAHLLAEEHLHFPTIWALRPEFKSRLRAFIRAHHHFRGLIQEVTGLIESDEREEAMYILQGLTHEFKRHEASEEDCLRSLGDEILEKGAH